MRGRQRVSSRETITAYDKDESSVRPLNSKPSWRNSLRHVLVASLSSFLFGYHLGVVNETLESISLELGFGGNTMTEGLVVSTCLGGAFAGSLFSGWIADGVGRRRAFQLCALPMIIGASMRKRRNCIKMEKYKAGETAAQTEAEQRTQQNKEWTSQRYNKAS